MPKNGYICDCGAINLPLVEHIIEKLPDDSTFYRIADFYKILGDSTRCKIIFALLDHEMCVCDLANVLSMTKSSISHQLSKMRKNGVVKCRRDGKEVYYALDDEHISEIFTVTMAHIEHR